MTPTQRSICGSVLILISTLSLAFILSHYSGRLGWMDFTSNDRYTLTEGTKSILAKVQRPLTAKLFFSKAAIDKIGTDQLKQFNGAYLYARDLLKSYERSSGGRLTLEEYDPEVFTPAAEEAASLGIRIERLTDTLTFAFGLAVTSDTGAKEVIPFINAREEGLFEYKITKLIERASRPSKRKLGILSSINVMGDNLSPEMERLYQAQNRPVNPKWNIVEWLSLDYEVEAVETTATEIPADFDFLMVVHPKNLPDPTVYAIDQYVMRGGKLIVFEDPFCESDQPPRTGGQQDQYAQFTHQRASDLNRLTNAWGVKMETGVILGDREIAYVQQGIQLMPYCMFTEAAECFNEEEAVTQSLDQGAQLLMAYTGKLTKVEGVEGVDVGTLVQTTASGGSRKFGNMDFMQMRQDPQSLWNESGPASSPDGEKVGFVPSKTPLIAAVRITGKLASAFPDGLPAAQNGDGKEGESETKPKHLKACDAENTVLVFADADLLGNNLISSPRDFFTNPMANRAVVLNGLDFLAGSSDLIGIRSRGNGRRGFEYIEDIRKEAAKETAGKMKSIQDEISKYQRDLQSLQQNATGKNVGIARSEALKREREANLNIMKRKRELNEVKRASTTEEEAVKATAKWLDVLGMPLLVFLIGLGLFLGRLAKRRNQMREDMA